LKESIVLAAHKFRASPKVFHPHFKKHPAQAGCSLTIRSALIWLSPHSVMTLKVRYVPWYVAYTPCQPLRRASPPMRCMRQLGGRQGHGTEKVIP
jgi:hypothetical protein